jgi:exonuclease III
LAEYVSNGKIKRKAFQFANYQQNSVSPKKRRAGVGCECKKRRKSKKAFTFGACPTTFLDFQVFCRAGRSIVFS